MMIRARAGLVSARTGLVNTARGLAKSYGERLHGCNVRNMSPEFGDVLASELSLRWVMITDEYGTDPTLHFKNTSININALTMISKRIEKDERVDVFSLFQKNNEALAGFVSRRK